jgi:hypothetical protein
MRCDVPGGADPGRAETSIAMINVAPACLAAETASGKERSFHHFFSVPLFEGCAEDRRIFLRCTLSN